MVVAIVVVSVVIPEIATVDVEGSSDKKVVTRGNGEVDSGKDRFPSVASVTVVILVVYGTSEVSVINVEDSVGFVIIFSKAVSLLAVSV